MSGGYYDAFRDKLAELTDKYLPENGVILDAGCGEGFYTLALYEKAKAKNRFGFRRGHLEIRGESGCGQI